MKLFILTPRPFVEGRNPWGTWYDKAFGFIVRAETEDDARRYANEVCGDEGPVWTHEKYTYCTILKDDGTPGVIMHDFRAA